MPGSTTPATVAPRIGARSFRAVSSFIKSVLYEKGSACWCKRMKNSLTTLCLVAALQVAPHLFAADSDVEIHCVAKKASEATKKASGEARMTRDMFGQPVLAVGGGTNKTNENWVYDVTIENKTFKELSGVEIKYTVFFKQEKQGSKEAPMQVHQNGTFTLPVLKPHEKQTFTTDSVELRKSNLVGEFHYANGGRIRAEDTLAGLAVRIYQNGQPWAEYANPSTLLKENWQ